MKEAAVGLVRRLLREGPPARHGGIEKRLAAFLWARIHDRVVGQPALAIEDEGLTQDRALMGQQVEGPAVLGAVTRSSRNPTTSVR
jgi:hypothetical protein